MPGFAKRQSNRKFGRTFPASRYDDPRGGHSSALGRNIFRYRAVEVTLYLFYAEEIRKFMLTNVYPEAVRDPAASVWESSGQRSIERIFFDLLAWARANNKLTIDDAAALKSIFADERHQGKKLKVAFGHAIKIGIFSAKEVDDLKGLLDYRNEIAHRVHMVMSDVSRSNWVIDHVSFNEPAYKGDALDRLRDYRRSLWERVCRKPILLTITMAGLLFEFAERVFEKELRRLERLIRNGIDRERQRTIAINVELDLGETELVDDLAPRFPANHRSIRRYGDDFPPPTGHLTKRGVEICYRLFDLGKSPIAVAYLMGMTLRSAERRQQGWVNAGGLQSVRRSVDRYDVKSLCRLSKS